jgi:penicillin amidase
MPVRRLLLVMLALAAMALGGGWWWARQSLPSLDGELGVAGLKDPVEVVFDGYAVPHVYARDPDDVWFAAGVLHARERLWQMELYRRVTSGRLSEVLGEGTLPIDKRFLTLNLRGAADAEWQRVRPEVKSALERYAAGVNAAAGALQPRQRPVEMQLLGITPAPWTPVDTLAVGRLLAWRLAENHQSELVRAAVAQKLGVDAARQLSGHYPTEAPTILGPLTDPVLPSESEGAPPPVAHATPAPEFPAPSRNSAANVWPAGLEWLHPMARRGNSNNWVVAGTKTSTKRPLLANDPHLLVEFPSVWYEMHLVAAGLDVIGVTIPGVPFVIIGHNRRVAWGFTNSGADVQDLALERLDVSRKRYMSSSGWQDAKVTRFDIPVRGRSMPEPFDMWETPRGIIFSEPGVDWEAPPAWMSPGVAAPAAGQVSAYALRWSGVDGDTASSFELIDRAIDWQTFTAALDRFDTPSQNAVYADVDGNIGYALNGRLPVRSTGDGTMPVNGASGLNWTDGPPPLLPKVLNPASGYLTSSNNEIDRRSEVLITRDWAAPFRTTRIHAELSAGSALGLDDMTRLQNDVKSLGAARVLAAVPAALGAAKKKGAEASAIETLTELAAWDGVVDGRPVVTLYEAFEHALWRRTFLDDMGEPLFRVFYQWAGGERPAGLHAILDDRQSRWFDDIATIEQRESRDDVFILAGRDAAEMVQAEFGRGSGRAWDRVHAITFQHPLGEGSWWRSWLFSRGPIPIAGDGTTVMRVSWNRARPFRGWEAPSWRQVFDVGEWDQARVVLPTGQSGHLMSPHYFDQNDLWRAGQYRTQPFTRNAVLAAQAHRLLLLP